MRTTAGLSDDDLIDPQGMPTERRREGGDDEEAETKGKHDGWREDCTK